jgi:DNA-binding beta-propeller fold protein YncE
VATLAGLAGWSGSADGTGSAAWFSSPSGVAVDSAGNVYVADKDNHTIRKVTPTGVVTTLAGLAGSYGSADGTGSAARFNRPGGVAVDSAGNIYVAALLSG